MTFTIPAAAIAGQAGFITDINNNYAALASVAGVNVLNSAYAGGADPTGAAASDSAFAAAVAAVPLTGGVIYVPPGTYKITTGVTVTLGSGAGPVQFFLSPGATISYTGSGDCFRMHSSVAAGPTGWRSGIIGDGVIDGTSAGNGACGAHVGDIPGLQLHCKIQNFQGTGSIGLHLDNAVTWTEEADVRCVVEFCTQQVVFEVTTGFPSFDYSSWDFTLLANPGQDGVVILNGPTLYSTSLMRIRGNFFTSASAFTNYVLKMTGKTPVGSAQPNVAASLYGNLDIQVETDGGLANNHLPLFMDAATAPFLSCQGRIWLLGFSQSSPALPANSFVFTGTLRGDPTLNPANNVGGYGWYGTGTVFPQPLSALSGGATTFLPTQKADFFSFTLSASTTISLTAGSNTSPGPQRKTIIIKQAAAGGPFTVTWPHAGSPTNASPSVLWAGGTAPTMTAAASAIDKYELTTYDGATWYGTAAQNLS